MAEPQPDVDELITVVEYDPSWPVSFEQERLRVQSALAGTVFNIEHVGSTAVVGMAGKPIVDILVGIPDLTAAAEYVRPLEGQGYENFGEIFIPGRHYLRKRGQTHFNIALTQTHGAFWNSQLLLRDYLREHPAEATAYSQCKRSVYAGGAGRFSTYSKDKHPFLADLIGRAEAWQRDRR